MKSHFFAYISRMRFIQRWALMRNTAPENVQEHSHQVAVLAHALAVIRNEKFGGHVDPGAVAVAVGLLLVLLLMFFLMAYYVNPIYRMLSGLKNYRSFGSKYSYTFEGDDQLSELNDGVTEVVGENIQLRKRIKMMRDTLEKHEHGQEAEK